MRFHENHNLKLVLKIFGHVPLNICCCRCTWSHCHACYICFQKLWNNFLAHWNCCCFYGKWGQVFVNSLWCSNFPKKSKGGITSSSEGAFLVGIGTLLFNEFWYILKMKVSFFLYWFFKSSSKSSSKEFYFYHFFIFY